MSLLEVPADLLAVLDKYDGYEGEDVAVMRKAGCRPVAILLNCKKADALFTRMKNDGWTSETISEIYP